MDLVKLKFKAGTLLLLLVSTLGIIVCVVACDKPAEDIVQGYLTVKVADNDITVTPVPDVEVFISPGNLTGTTNSIGIYLFILDPGEYTVVADVCCIGPSNIHYDESVTVAKADTAEITLMACLRCL